MQGFLAIVASLAPILSQFGLPNGVKYVVRHTRIAHIPAALREYFTFESMEKDEDWGPGWKRFDWNFALPQPALKMLLEKRFPGYKEPDEVHGRAYYIEAIKSHQVFFALRYLNEDHASYILDMDVELDTEKTPVPVMEEIGVLPEVFYPPRRTWVVQKMRKWREEVGSWKDYPLPREIQSADMILEILTHECVALCNITEEHPRIKALDLKNISKGILTGKTWYIREWVSCSRCDWRGFEDGDYDEHSRPVMVTVDQETGEGTYLCPACFQKSSKCS